MSAVRGFTAVPNVIIRDATLPASTRLLYGVMLSYAWTVRGCTASVETLCEEAGIGRSAFFESTKALRARGLLRIEKRVTKNGWRNVYFPVTEVRGVTVTGDEEIDEEGVVRGPDEGSSGQPDGGSSATRTQKKTKGEEDSSADADDGGTDPRSEIPAGFPDELRPHARQVMEILVAVATDHGAKKLWPKALGLLMMGDPHRPFVKTANELRVWAVDPNRPIKDVLGTYRTFLKRSDQLQGVERLAGGAGSQRPGSPPRFTREDDD